MIKTEKKDNRKAESRKQKETGRNNVDDISLHQKVVLFRT